MFLALFLSMTNSIQAKTAPTSPIQINEIPISIESDIPDAQAPSIMDSYLESAPQLVKDASAFFDGVKQHAAQSDAQMTLTQGALHEKVGLVSGGIEAGFSAVLKGRSAAGKTFSLGALAVAGAQVATVAGKAVADVALTGAGVVALAGDLISGNSYHREIARQAAAGEEINVAQALTASPYWKDAGHAAEIGGNLLKTGAVLLAMSPIGKPLDLRPQIEMARTGRADIAAVQGEIQRADGALLLGSLLSVDAKRMGDSDYWTLDTVSHIAASALLLVGGGRALGKGSANAARLEASAFRGKAGLPKEAPAVKSSPAIDLSERTTQVFTPAEVKAARQRSAEHPARAFPLGNDVWSVPRGGVPKPLEQ